MEPDPDTIVVRDSTQPVSNDESQSANPFSCNVCGKSYTRIDHLARHYRSRQFSFPFLSVPFADSVETLKSGPLFAKSAAKALRECKHPLLY